MALTTEINSAADIMASTTSNARDSIPSAWYPQDKLPLVTTHMKKAEANALFQISNLPFQTAMAYGQTSTERPILGQNWFNKGAGWAEAGARRVPLTGSVELRGVLYCNTLTYPIVMTLPPALCPAQNEQHATTMYSVSTGVLPATLYIYTNGQVGLWSVGLYNGAAPTIVEYLTLSGISYEAYY